jgi:hypothetical protein
VRALILEDYDEAYGTGSSWPTARGAFADTPVEAVSVGYFRTWDGGIPTEGVDVVLWLSAKNYNWELTPAGEATLNMLTARGVGLVRTEWAAYAVSRDYFGSPARPPYGLLPVEYGGSYWDSGDVGDWSIALPAHPLATGLIHPHSYAGGSVVSVTPGATAVLMVDPSDGGEFGNTPTLTVSESEGFRLVHFNHDLCYRAVDGAGLCDLGPEMDRVLRNAVIYAGHGTP